MNIKQAIGSALVATAIFAAPAQSAEFLDFTIDESNWGGIQGGFTADKFNGSYVEVISFDAALNFSTSAIIDFTSILSDEGTAATPSGLASTAALLGNYSLYAIFSATGNTAPLGGGDFAFNGSTGTFDLYLDANRDTVKTLGDFGFSAVNVAGNGDDLLLASAINLSASAGTLEAGTGGFFDLFFDDFTLTMDGEDYFSAPIPFHLIVNVDGDFDNFAVDQTQTISGDVSAVFVPAPSTLAVLGLGLTVLGFTKRKKA